MFKSIKVRTAALLILGCIKLNAQETVLSSGSDAGGVGGSASYSIGQSVYTTVTGINGSMTQGVQQAFEISIVSSIKEAEGIHLFCYAFPNPVTDRLTLKVENYDISDLSYRLYDGNGKLIKAGQLETNESDIDLSNVGSAIYFLSVTEKNKEIKSFKIIKN